MNAKCVGSSVLSFFDVGLERTQKVASSPQNTPSRHATWGKTEFCCIMDSATKVVTVATKFQPV